MILVNTLNISNMEHKDGEHISINVTLEVKYTSEYSCKDCFFASKYGCKRPKEWYCDSSRRTDHKDVIYKVIKME